MSSKRFELAASLALLAGAMGAAQASDSPNATTADSPSCTAGDTSATTASRTASLYRAAVAARDAGETKQADRLFADVVANDPDHRAARQALGHVRSGGDWLTRREAMHAKGLVLHDGAWILAEEATRLDQPAAERKARRAAEDKVAKLLRTYAAGDARARRFAKNALGQIPTAHKIDPLAHALRSASPDVRRLAARTLGDIGNRRVLRPLLHRVIHDTVADVRHAALDAAKAIGDANLIAPLVKALGSENQTKRVRAAEGLARARDVRGVRYLVYRFEAHGGGAPRSYSMFTSQVSFIQDFDVEVASTAFIADPIVGTIQEGVVLDAQVIATEQVEHFVEREVIYGALTELTGATDVPNERGAWAAWFREHGEALERSARDAVPSKDTLSASGETAAR